LAVADRALDGRPVSAKTEVVLADAGLTNEEIAVVTGKSADTVRKSVERARKRGT